MEVEITDELLKHISKKASEHVYINNFKYRAYNRAYQILYEMKADNMKLNLDLKELIKIKYIGKSIASVIIFFYNNDIEAEHIDIASILC